MGLHSSIIIYQTLLFCHCRFRQDDLCELGQHALQFLVVLESSHPLVREAVEAVRTVLCLISESRDEVVEVRRGRPPIHIEREQLCFLIEEGFRINDIAAIFSCSRRTIERRLGEFQLRCCDYSRISDATLDEVVGNVVLLYPHCGEKSVTGRLRSQGYQIQRERIRQSMRRVDPEGVHARMRGVLKRRVYSVQSPNSLWHLDGYHKLIRWGIVIHGCIDGYSRLITFMKVSSNNRALTVLHAFNHLKAIDSNLSHLPL